MDIRAFCVNPFQMNCLVCHDEGEAVLIDPGPYADAERDVVLEYIRVEGLVLQKILLTHGHIDHIFDLAYFREAYGCPYVMHQEDLPLIRDAVYRSSTYGLAMQQPPDPDGFLKEGDTVAVGRATWDVVHTPGHSPGSISFVDRTNRFVISGDVLFSGSVGRTDLWRGSMEVLLQSIFDKLLVLPDDFTVYCGHGPATTIGAERDANPFLTKSRRGA